MARVVRSARPASAEVTERELRDALAQVTRLQRELSSMLDRSRPTTSSPPALVVPDVAAALLADPSEPRPAIRLLGTFEVDVAGRSIPVGSGGKSAAVLKFLAASGTQTVPRELILDALWPDVPASVAASRLRSALHQLRRAFAEARGRHGVEDEIVSYEHGQYLLFPGRMLVTDVDLFEDAWARGQRHDRVGEVAQAVEWYARAERLYRGDFLEQDQYLEWTTLRREQLRDAYLTLLSRLADLSLRAGDELGTIASCHKLLRRDSCNEEAYRLLMEVHGRRGDRNAVSRWYDLCERELQRSMGVAPSEITRRARDGALRLTGSDELPTTLATAG